MKKISIKSENEMRIMAEGGRKLGVIKKELASRVKEGVNALEIENLAQELIKKTGGKPSFMMVPGYSWATCVNVNEGLVHGIPKREIVFKKGDVVSIDVGLFYKGFHTDTSVTVAIEPGKEIVRFLEVGKTALKQAIKVCRSGNYILDISRVIEETIKKAGYTPIRALVGHGVGRELHEEPAIPCFLPAQTGVPDNYKFTNYQIKTGMVLAIEIMYAQGNPDIEIGKDRWTISMADGKISALFEETVAVRSNGSLALTA
jgi:methionyl aminopeptidase